MQLSTGPLYPRSSSKTEKKLSFDTLIANLFPAETAKFVQLIVKKRLSIPDFVESHGHKYVPGKAFYQHTKSETISVKKKILLQEKLSGQLFEGDAVREMLGLNKETPDWNIQPSNFDRRIAEFYRAFVQSTSVNRALVSNTLLLYEIK